MDTIESSGLIEERPASGGFVQILRKLLAGLFGGQTPNTKSRPAAKTAAQTSDAEQIVVAPGGYQIRVNSSARVSENIGQMLDPVREGLNLLPPLPQVVADLLREIQNEKSSSASVGEIVSSDPALSAALIRAVNSSAFALKRRVTSVGEAVSFLGFSVVKSMVIRLRLSDALMPTTQQGAQDAEDIWIHSLAVSYAADCLAQRFADVDRGFVSTLGLLHDVGKLAVLARLPEKAQTISELVAQSPETDPREIEAKVLGVDHALLGADLAARWKLPSDLVQAIRWHHNPSQAFHATDPLPLRKAVCILQIADQLAKYCYP